MGLIGEPRTLDVRTPSPLGLAGLAVAAPVAVTGGWSLAEFCWSTWLAGLLLTWLCVLSGGLQIVFALPKWRAHLERHVPALGRLPQPATVAVTVAVVAVLTVLAIYAYTFAFGFYGLLLSFFAEMEPHALFGRNGFINSDFWTPVGFLAVNFWAMSVGIVVAYGPGIIRTNPWKRMLLPFATEVVRVHVMVVVMPFLALIAWAALGDSYQSVVIVLLMAVFYILPGRSRAIESATAQDSPKAEHVPT
jgi:hypothetical protein